MRIHLSALIPLFAVAANAPAQRAPQWGDLQPGPYEVGFRVIATHDRTRTYWPPVAFDGRRDTRDTARPIQISLWYPARRSAGAPRMSFGDHVAIDASALGATRTTPEARAEAVAALRRGPFRPYLGDERTDGTMRTILGTPTASIRDAAPAAGAFPVIIHLGSTIGQIVLLEYLASHGYVVASIPVLGTAPAWYGRGEGTAAAHLAAAQDVGFVHATVGALPFADETRAAAIGMLTAGAVLYQMDHQALRAIALLDGSLPESLRDAPGFDLNAMRIPVLDMPNTSSRERPMLDSMRYAERFRVGFRDVSHAHFYAFERIARPDRAAEHTSYGVISRYTLAFLDHALKEDSSAAVALSGNPAQLGAPPDFLHVTRQPALPPAPTAEEFLLLVRENAIVVARSAWDAYREEPSTRPLVAEGPLTTTLLFLRRDVGPADAMEGFQLLTDMFPASWRAKEQFAATLRQAGNASGALAAYRAALALLRAGPDGPDRPSHDARLSTMIAELER